MTTENEREIAQLTRTAEHNQAELALVVVEVVARDEAGRITQWRKFDEAGPEVIKAFHLASKQAQKRLKTS